MRYPRTRTLLPGTAGIGFSVRCFRPAASRSTVASVSAAGALPCTHSLPAATILVSRSNRARSFSAVRANARRLPSASPMIPMPRLWKVRTVTPRAVAARADTFLQLARVSRAKASGNSSDGFRYPLRTRHPALVRHTEVLPLPAAVTTPDCAVRRQPPLCTVPSSAAEPRSGRTGRATGHHPAFLDTPGCLSASGFQAHRTASSANTSPTLGLPPAHRASIRG